MDRLPKVSIVIPNHNKAPYLSDAINSAFSQTWENIEVIVLDDASNDNSIEILDAVNHPKFHFYKVDFKNASAVRNEGVRISTGDFIQFLDSDDILHPDKIASQLKDMKLDEGSLGVCNTKAFYSIIEDAGNEIDTAFLQFSSEPFLFLSNLYKSVDSGMVQPNAWLIPKRILEKAGEWNESLTLDDDGEYFCRVILASDKIVHTNKALNYYRKFRHFQSNLSSQKSYVALLSSLHAAQLKNEHIERYIKQNKISVNKGEIINPLFVNVMVSAYPEYKHVSILAEKCIDFSIPVAIPKLGGRIVEILKSILGWKLTKYLKVQLRK